MAAAFGSDLCAGYISTMSMPACCFSRLIRAQQFRFSVPVLDGSARQFPLIFDRYSWIGLY